MCSSNEQTWDEFKLSWCDNLPSHLWKYWRKARSGRPNMHDSPTKWLSTMCEENNVNWTYVRFSGVPVTAKRWLHWPFYAISYSLTLGHLIPLINIAAVCGVCLFQEGTVAYMYYVQLKFGVSFTDHGGIFWTTIANCVLMTAIYSENFELKWTNEYNECKSLLLTDLRWFYKHYTGCEYTSAIKTYESELLKCAGMVSCPIFRSCILTDYFPKLLFPVINVRMIQKLYSYPE